MLTEAQRTDLITAATAVRDNAYAKYSKFHVGAALLTESGRLFTGCNVENISYGLTICAERFAIGAMIAAGERQPTAIAIVTKGGGTPCGACRQVLAEFAPSLPILLVDADTGAVVETDLAKLLPSQFASEFVGNPTGG
jgi:cytidine deaminase